MIVVETRGDESGCEPLDGLGEKLILSGWKSSRRKRVYVKDVDQMRTIFIFISRLFRRSENTDTGF